MATDLETRLDRALAAGDRADAKRSKRTRNPGGLSVCADCPSHPDGGTHECLAAEMRCAYCGERLAPYPCHGCNKFLTAKRMHDAAQGENWRCEECEP